MDKPHSFAGRVIQKYGRQIKNEHAQPEKFFFDLRDMYVLLDGIPFSAVEDLEKYETNRDIVINIIRKLFKITDAAKIDIIREINKQDENPFDGLEEDIKIKKQRENKKN